MINLEASFAPQLAGAIQRILGHLERIEAKLDEHINSHPPVGSEDAPTVPPQVSTVLRIHNHRQRSLRGS